MWLGYGFDAAEFISVMIRYGFVYANVVWMYVFFGYLGLLVLVALLITLKGIENIGQKDQLLFGLFQADVDR